MQFKLLTNTNIEAMDKYQKYSKELTQTKELMNTSTPTTQSAPP